MPPTGEQGQVQPGKPGKARFPREARLLPLVGESGVVSGMQVAECDPDGTDLLAW